MRRIKLTQGKWATVDDADYPRLSKYTWHLLKSGYAVRVATKRDGAKERIYMQRDILRVPTDVTIGRVRNDRRRNNQRSNLRITTPSHSQANRLRQSNNTSGYKGVEKFKKQNIWRAQIVDNYRKIHLGCFKTAVEAAFAYDKAAVKYHDEFARLNFPSPHSKRKRAQ